VTVARGRERCNQEQISVSRVMVRVRFGVALGEEKESHGAIASAIAGGRGVCGSHGVGARRVGVGEWVGGE